MGEGLKFGLFYSLESPARWHQGFHHLYRMVLHQALLAEELGYESVFFTEHHSSEDGQLPSPLILASAVAGRTERIRVGTAIVILPLYHPVRLAEDLAVLDHLSNGRLIVGIGGGFLQEEYDSYGIPIKQRPSRMEEGLEILLRCWTEDRFSYHGKYYDVKNVAVQPKPSQKPHPPIWLGATRRPALERVARWDVPLLLSLGTIQAVRYTRERFVDILKQQGRHVQGREQPLLRDVYVAQTDKKAWEEAGPHLMYVYKEVNLPRGMVDVYEDGQFRFAQSASDPVFGNGGRNIVQDRLIVGSPATCIQEIERYREATGTDHLVMRMQCGGLAPEKAEASIRLFAREVMPHFRK